MVSPLLAALLLFATVTGPFWAVVIVRLIPERLWPAGPHREVGTGGDGRVEAGDRLVALAQGQPRRAPVGVGPGVARIERQGLFGTLQGLVRAAQGPRGHRVAQHAGGDRVALGLVGVEQAFRRGARDHLGQLAESAAQVQTLARELYSRLATMGGHFAKLGGSLKSAAKPIS